MEDTCIVLAPPCNSCSCTDPVPISVRSKYLADYRHKIPNSDTGKITRFCLKRFPGEPNVGCSGKKVSPIHFDVQTNVQKHPCKLLVVPYYDETAYEDEATPGILTYLVEDSPDTGDHFTPYRTDFDQLVLDPQLGWVKKLKPESTVCPDCECLDKKLEVCERHMFLSLLVNANQIRSVSENSSLAYPIGNDYRYNMGMHFINERFSNLARQLHRPYDSSYPTRIVVKDGIFELDKKLYIKRTKYVRDKQYPHHVVLHTVFDRSLFHPTDDYNKYYPSSQRRDITTTSNLALDEENTTSIHSKRQPLDVPWAMQIENQFHDFWYKTAKELGDLPLFKSRFPFHIPLEMADYNMYDYDREELFSLSVNNNFEDAIISLARDMHTKNKGFLLPDTTICYALKPLLQNEGDVLQLNRSVPQFTLRKSSITVPIAIESKEGPRPSVLYDYARHMNIGQADSIWVGDVRFKPHETLLKNVSTWRETPLRNVNLVPGVYVLGATAVKEEAMLETEYCSRFNSCYDMYTTRTRKLPSPIDRCNTCKRLWTKMCDMQKARLADNTLHASLILTDVIVNNKQHETKPRTQPHGDSEDINISFWEHDVNNKRYFKNYVNVWACHEQEMKEISQMPVEEVTDLLKPFNWWDNIDRDSYRNVTGVSRELVYWPLPTAPENFDNPPELDVRTARLACSTKLVIKNPQTFFDRDIITVDIACGGRRGAVYSLVDRNSWEVCGMLLVDIRGRTTAVHHTDRNSRIVGLHFEPKTSQTYWKAVSWFATHICEPHTDDTLHIRLRSRPQARTINYNSFEADELEYVPVSGTVPVGRLTHPSRHCVNVCSFRTNTSQPKTVSFKVYANLFPFDEFWYSRENGTPYDLKTFEQ